MTHADIAWLAEVLEVDDSRWCHRTVDSDCLLTVLVEESFEAVPAGEALADALADAFERLGAP